MLSPKNAISKMAIFVRRAKPEDADAIGEIQVATWQGAYAQILHPEFLKNLNAKSSAEKWRPLIESGWQIFVAEVNGHVAGYALWEEKQLENWPHANTLAALYVSPQFQGIGIGKSLIFTVANLAKHSGHQGMMIGAFRDNFPARDLYESLGARKCIEDLFEVDGIGYPEVVYAWDDLDDLIGRVSDFGV